jgi:maltooligosyltrehalose trehalohydrolase
VTAPLGLSPGAHGWHAEVWAPKARAVVVSFPAERTAVALEAGPNGYFTGDVGDHEVGTHYELELDGVIVADPASRDQPEGVHGPSALVDPRRFVWHDHDFHPPTLRDLVIYELHIGTFRAPSDPEVPGGRRPGTFASAAQGLESLRELGVTAVESMPIASFPGTRNWGYDGVFLFAPQASYGGPEGFASFVDDAHRLGLAVVLDVVYNHIGPEGAVLDTFGPYTTSAYTTPWGPAMNVDRAGSDEVRRFFIENARMWFADFHVDALRLDAIHGIVDTTARPFLAELADAVRQWERELGRSLLLIAESADNDPRVLRPTADGGYGMDAQWSDDFHHALHVLVTGERRGYYADYEPAELATAVTSGWSVAGRYSTFRGRRHGAPPATDDPLRFVVAAQNHDQIGNRPAGDRLSTLVDPDVYLAIAGVLLTCPHIPLLFMGEEDAERAPFSYFVDHQDPGLLEAVRQGRRAEFGEADADDPGDPATFARSCLSPGDGGSATRRIYRDLLSLRRTTPLLTDPGAQSRCAVDASRYVLVRSGQAGRCLVVANLAPTPAVVDIAPGSWRRALASRPEVPEALESTHLELLGAGFACFLENGGTDA